MSFTVTKRRREIGIRAALGAHPRRIMASIFARASRGEMTGGAGAVVLPAVAALMLVVSLLAATGPARHTVMG